MVADIASKLDKKAELNVSGEDIFLENQKLDLISDALTHILRNSIDHGIEKMDKRKERQKEEFGTISISTKDVNNIFEILIVDDGNGIDGDRVMNSAVKKGALAKEKADTMNDDEKVNLIFLPNLSTAETVSEVSGRGVGMDVVKSNIEKLGGEIKVSSKLGQGTTFKISFPSAA
jgi:two-component system chemotaxis sensor kinase CheA